MVLAARPTLAEVPLADLSFELSLTAAYRIVSEQLDDSLAASLAAGEFWRFPFNYRPDYRSETGYLVQSARNWQRPMK
jgi:hypothetical protein